jgi:hypothetical protein
MDTAFLCPQETNLIQRYVMAVFYYSSRGDRWTQCSAPGMFDNQTAIELANEACTIEVSGGNSSAWLTPSEECSWGGLLCNDADAVIRIDFGTN